jgi:hypothetical protein
MPGPGICRDCHACVRWGANPDGSGRSFPFDEPTQLTPHFSTCAAVERPVDPFTGETVRVSRCAGCRAPIWWHKSRAGNNVPFTVGPEGGPEREPHFQICPGRAGGRAWVGSDWEEEQPVFHPTRPQVPGWQRELQEHLLVLELTWPCTGDDLRHAFRQLAHARHPDHDGGSTEQFRALKDAYDRASHLVARYA